MTVASGGDGGGAGLFPEPGTGGTQTAGGTGGGGSGFGPAGVVFESGVRSGAGEVTVTFTEPVETQIADLKELVAGLRLPKGLTTALNSKLDEALAALDADDTAAACGSLQAFLNQVAAQNGKKLTEAQAQQLTDAANEIRAMLDC